MSEYHKIETLYERDEKTHKLKQPLVLKNPTYDIIKTWVFTEKIDGTNIRVNWIGKKMTFGGRTDNASLPADLIKWLYEHITPQSLEAVFPDSDAVVIYGEGYGPGIQKGGGDYCDSKRFIVFDVAIQSDNRIWWLNDANMRDVARKLNLDAVPLIGEMDLSYATEFVRKGFPSRLNGGKKQAEGMVGRPLETLYDKKGSRLIIKLKTCDFG